MIMATSEFDCTIATVSQMSIVVTIQQTWPIVQSYSLHTGGETKFD